MAGANERRAAILNAARGWIGTPYHHQASVRGVGCDCLGLVRGVWREVYGCEPEASTPYSRDWGETSGIETLIDGAARHMRRVTPADALPADVLVFRMRDGAIAKHAGLLSGAGLMIHAMEGCRLNEVPVGVWWRRRIAAAFRFPGV